MKKLNLKTHIVNNKTPQEQDDMSPEKAFIYLIGSKSKRIPLPPHTSMSNNYLKIQGLWNLFAKSKEIKDGDYAHIIEISIGDKTNHTEKRVEIRRNFLKKLLLEFFDSNHIEFKKNNFKSILQDINSEIRQDGKFKTLSSPAKTLDRDFLVSEFFNAVEADNVDQSVGLLSNLVKNKWDYSLYEHNFLHIALSVNAVNICKYLLNDKKVDPNTRAIFESKELNTPLTEAALFSSFHRNDEDFMKKRGEILTLLISNATTNINLKSFYGHLPFVIFAQENLLEFMEMISARDDFDILHQKTSTIGGYNISHDNSDGKEPVTKDPKAKIRIDDASTIIENPEDKMVHSLAIASSRSHIAATEFILQLLKTKSKSLGCLNGEFHESAIPIIKHGLLNAAGNGNPELILAYVEAGVDLLMCCNKNGNMNLLSLLVYYRDIECLAEICESQKERDIGVNSIIKIDENRQYDLFSFAMHQSYEANNFEMADILLKRDDLIINNKHLEFINHLIDDFKNLNHSTKVSKENCHKELQRIKVLINKRIVTTEKVPELNNKTDFESQEILIAEESGEAKIPKKQEEPSNAEFQFIDEAVPNEDCKGNHLSPNYTDHLNKNRTIKIFGGLKKIEFSNDISFYVAIDRKSINAHSDSSKDGFTSDVRKKFYKSVFDYPKIAKKENSQGIKMLSEYTNPRVFEAKLLGDYGNIRIIGYESKINIEGEEKNIIIFDRVTNKDRMGRGDLGKPLSTERSAELFRR